MLLWQQVEPSVKRSAGLIIVETTIWINFFFFFSSVQKREETIMKLGLSELTVMLLIQRKGAFISQCRVVQLSQNLVHNEEKN